MKKTFTATGIVKKFPQKGGWTYLPIKQTYKELGGKPKWGLVPARITVGKTTWCKSLLPYGDGSLFVALSAKVRQAENIKVGDKISASFQV